MKEDYIVKLARHIAYEAHEGQFRKDGKTRFITHPEAVAKSFVYKVYQAVGWLHDVVEASNISFADLLNEGIPFEVVSLVEVLTKRENESYLNYILRVKQNPKAVMIKLADLNHNISTCESKSNTLKDKYVLAKHILNIGSEE